jgi:hypothetical protein
MRYRKINSRDEASEWILEPTTGWMAKAIKPTGRTRFSPREDMNPLESEYLPYAQTGQRAILGNTNESNLISGASSVCSSTLVVAHRRVSSPIIRPGPALLWIDREHARAEMQITHACHAAIDDGAAPRALQLAGHVM